MADKLRQAEEQPDAFEGKSLSDVEGTFPRTKTEGIAEDTLRALVNSFMEVHMSPS